MKKMKKIGVFILTGIMLLSSMLPVFADASDTYVSLGADLTTEQRATVLSLLDLTEEELADLDVAVITNAMEHELLGKYLPANVIGSRALSCVRIDKKKSDGIHVTTKNISYCTEGMYQNALITAGIENADVIVAGPISISGTAGLVGAMQAYEGLTGASISQENSDAAIDEIVTTGDLASTLGDSDEAENLVALIKQKVIANDSSTDEEILKMIDEGAAEIGISLNENEKQQLLRLMKKIAQLDLDPDTLKKQASDIYNRLKDLGVDMSDLDKDTVVSGLTKILQGIINFFKGLFS